MRVIGRISEATQRVGTVVCGVMKGQRLGQPWCWDRGRNIKKQQCTVVKGLYTSQEGSAIAIGDAAAPRC